jgi:hypothetical protein
MTVESLCLQISYCIWRQRLKQSYFKYVEHYTKEQIFFEIRLPTFSSFPIKTYSVQSVIDPAWSTLFIGLDEIRTHNLLHVSRVRYPLDRSEI